MERKEKILKMLKEDESIDNNSIYDLLYLLYFNIALMQSTEDFLNGNVIAFEDVMREMDAKYTNCY